MGMTTAILAFSQRGARRGHLFGLLAYSALLTALLIGVAAFIAPIGRADDLARIRMAGNSAARVAATQWPDWTTLGLAGVFSAILLALAGFVLAPAMVASAVTQERRLGTLDQLRTTPLSPLQLALGFVVGVPARLYLVCVGPLIVHILATLAGPAPLSQLLGSLGILASGTLASCAIGLCVALAPRQESGGALVALGVAAGLGGIALTTATMAACASSVTGWALCHPAGGLSALLQSEPTLWRRMMTSGAFDAADQNVMRLGFVAVASLVASLLLAGLLLYAACRKLAAPQLPLLSKPLALLLFGLAVAMLLAPFLDSRTSFDDATAVAFSFLLWPLVALLGMQTTPTFEAWAMAWRRGRRFGWRADDAAPHGVMWLMQAAWLAILVAHGDTIWSHYRSPAAIGWLLLTVLTLPIYVLFAGTRYGSPAARGAFWVAISVHLVTQVIGQSAAAHNANRDAGAFVTMIVDATALAALLVPAWVVWRQRVLARSLVTR